ncbi:MAG: hypothetical protein A2284_00950 [Deltaproteobacteria bacterium RIFOXYA12_FULL_61_11]|nr:MAG: hypothetical protein A2284_00950 [Deltaproteobacteria bacterium RIFOXYA12_FULL_61_11]
MLRRGCLAGPNIPELLSRFLLSVLSRVKKTTLTFLFFLVLACTPPPEDPEEQRPEAPASQPDAPGRIVLGTGSDVQQEDGSALGYIHELPHPRFIAHYHPSSGEQFLLEHARFALEHELHSLELDLHLRQGQVVVNHDGPTEESPTLEEVLRLVETWPTPRSGRGVHGDGLQFFLVLEPKSDDPALFDALTDLLELHRSGLSTSAERGGQPRALTAVITGSHREAFLEQQGLTRLNQLCLVEGHEYGGTIFNLSELGEPFQWAGALEHGKEGGKVNQFHLGGFNLRIWNCHDALPTCLASGADALNLDRGEVEAFEAMLAAQEPRGASPSLSLRGDQALLTWRGANGDNLYLSLGKLGADGLQFTRQFLLTDFLTERPKGPHSASTLLADGAFLTILQDSEHQRLSALSGTFTRVEPLPTFSGSLQTLTLPGDAGRRGTTPEVAVTRDGRVLILYEGISDHRLRYLSGRLGDDGLFRGEEHELGTGDGISGIEPGLAIDGNGRVFIPYRVPDSQDLHYFSGRVSANGTLSGTTFSLTEGDARRGSTPSAAFAPDGRLLVVYQGTSEQRLWYVTGTLGEDGRLTGTEFCLSEGESRRGGQPTVAFNASGNAIVLYQGTSEQRFWYVLGTLDSAGKLLGQEQQLFMALDRR